MRLATYNVENLFARAKALNKPTWAQGRVVLEQQARINELLGEAVYDQPMRAAIIELLTALGLAHDDDGGAYARLRQNRGRLVRRPRGGGVEIVASGRDAWIGWVELKTEPIDELATRHTAMVIRDVGADVQAVVEAESRPTLRDFSAIMLAAVGAAPFADTMLIEGNDLRGIDVGILTRAGYELTTIRSHVDDSDADGVIFSRDCIEYTVTTPGDGELVVLVNHLKSKGYGTTAASNERRRRQAARVATIYRRLRRERHRNVAVVGDLNDTPDSAPLAPLLTGTDLRDVTTHPSFTDDGRPGTYANGTKSNKIDYVLLSPALWGKVRGGAIFRKGVWGGVNGTLFPHYESMTAPQHAASDHAAVYADLEL